MSDLSTLNQLEKSLKPNRNLAAASFGYAIFIAVFLTGVIMEISWLATHMVDGQYILLVIIVFMMLWGITAICMADKGRHSS